MNYPILNIIKILKDTDRHSYFPASLRWLCLSFSHTDVYSKVCFLNWFHSIPLYYLLLERWIHFYDWSCAFLFRLSWSQGSSLQVLATVSSGLVQTTWPYRTLFWEENLEDEISPQNLKTSKKFPKSGQISEKTILTKFNSSKIDINEEKVESFINLVSL